MGVIKFALYVLTLLSFLVFYVYGGNVVIGYISNIEVAIICGIVLIALYQIIKNIREKKIKVLEILKNNFGVDQGTLKRKSKIFIRKFFKYKAVWFAIFVLGIFTIMAYKPEIFMRHPYEILYRYTELRDMSLAPSLAHPFGLHPSGYDNLTIMAINARNVLKTPLMAALYSVIIGVMLGTIAGYFKGFVDKILMLIVESMLAFAPIMLFLLVLMVFRHPDIRIWMFSIFGGCTLAKIIRAELFSLREREFVQQAKAAGCSEFEVIFRHLLPNCISSILLQTSNFVGQVLMYDAMLAFLGFGGSGWAQVMGGLFRRYQGYVVRVAPWTVAVSGLLIFILIISVNIIGEALRGAMEVKENG